jgi:hypothetical protein
MGAAYIRSTQRRDGKYIKYIRNSRLDNQQGSDHLGDGNDGKGYLRLSV